MNDGAQERILVVDDEPSIVDAVSTALRYEGYEVEQERPQRRVRRDVGDREPERRQHDHPEHKASAQRSRPGLSRK